MRAVAVREVKLWRARNQQRKLTAQRSVKSTSVRDGHGVGFLVVTGQILMAIRTKARLLNAEDFAGHPAKAARIKLRPP